MQQRSKTESRGHDAKPKRVVATPGLLFQCPSCDVKSSLPGVRGVVHIGSGGVVKLTCAACAQPLELWAGEPPRIAQPGQLNRHIRRAQAAASRIVKP